MANFLFIRIRIVREQLLCHENEARRAEAALKRPALDKRVLYRRERPTGVKMLNRGDVLSVGGYRKIKAAGYSHAVNQHGTAATQALAAALARTVKSKLMQQLDEVAMCIHPCAHRA